MKARLAAAALLLAAATASAALNAYRTGITLPQAVRLGDGSVLPAGRYDVQIDYKGFGNAAELHFFQGGVLKGKTPAEARGFPAQARTGAVASQDKKIQKADIYPKVGDIKGETGAVKEVSPDAKLKKVVGPGEDKTAKNLEWSDPTVLPPAAFDWQKAGFAAGAQGKAAPAGPGSLKLQFDSSNSAAGFSALLPAVQKQR